MKKNNKKNIFLYLIATLMIILTSASAMSLTVTSPTSDTEYTIGDQATISWTGGSPTDYNISINNGTTETPITSEQAFPITSLEAYDLPSYQDGIRITDYVQEGELLSVITRNTTGFYFTKINATSKTIIIPPRFLTNTGTIHSANMIENLDGDGYVIVTAVLNNDAKIGEIDKEGNITTSFFQIVKAGTTDMGNPTDIIYNYNNDGYIVIGAGSYNLEIAEYDINLTQTQKNFLGGYTLAKYNAYATPKIFPWTNGTTNGYVYTGLNFGNDKRYIFWLNETLDIIGNVETDPNQDYELSSGAYKESKTSDILYLHLKGSNNYDELRLHAYNVSTVGVKNRIYSWEDSNNDGGYVQGIQRYDGKLYTLSYDTDGEINLSLRIFNDTLDLQETYKLGNTLAFYSHYAIFNVDDGETIAIPSTSYNLSKIVMLEDQYKYEWDTTGETADSYILIVETSNGSDQGNVTNITLNNPPACPELEDGNIESGEYFLNGEYCTLQNNTCLNGNTLINCEDGGFYTNTESDWQDIFSCSLNNVTFTNCNFVWNETNNGNWFGMNTVDDFTVKNNNFTTTTGASMFVFNGWIGWSWAGNITNIEITNNNFDIGESNGIMTISNDNSDPSSWWQKTIDLNFENNTVNSGFLEYVREGITLKDNTFNDSQTRVGIFGNYTFEEGQTFPKVSHNFEGTYGLMNNTLIDGSGSTFKQLSISNILRATYKNFTGMQNIEFNSNTEYATFEDFEIKNKELTYPLITMDGNWGGLSYLTIKDSLFENINITGYSLMWIGNMDHVRFENNIFEDIGIKSNYKIIDLYLGNNHEITNNQIINSWTDKSDYNGDIIGISAYNVNITNNKIENFTRYNYVSNAWSSAISIEDSAYNTQVINNNITNIDLRALDLYKTNNVLIDNNRIIGTMTTGDTASFIGAVNTPKLTITNNYAENIGGILFAPDGATYNFTDVLIENNYFKNPLNNTYWNTYGVRYSPQNVTFNNNTFELTKDCIDDGVSGQWCNWGYLYGSTFTNNEYISNNKYDTWGIEFLLYNYETDSVTNTLVENNNGDFRIRTRMLNGGDLIGEIKNNNFITKEFANHAWHAYNSQQPIIWIREDGGDAIHNINITNNNFTYDGEGAIYFRLATQGNDNVLIENNNFNIDYIDYVLRYTTQEANITMQNNEFNTPIVNILTGSGSYNIDPNFEVISEAGELRHDVTRHYWEQWSADGVTYNFGGVTITTFNSTNSDTCQFNNFTITNIGFDGGENNTYSNVIPTYVNINEFYQGAETSNLIVNIDLDNISELTLEENDGKIEWENNINVSKETNLDGIINIKNKEISVDSTTNNELNSTANIYFKSTGFTSINEVHLYKDGILCTTQCTNITLNTGTVKATVTGFSNYTLRDCENNTNCGLCEKCSSGTCTNQASNEDLKDECTAGFNTCPTEYLRTGDSGYCDGAGACSSGDITINVTAGNICHEGADNNPNSTNNCAVWYDCNADTCYATEYYVGYAGDETSNCVNTDWQVTGSNYFAPDGYIVNNTNQGLACTTINTGKTTTYHSCLNNYIRTGDSGYCDGSGSLKTNDINTNVSNGNVCISGNDTNPTITVNCNIWSDCIYGDNTANEYYTGYLGDGTNTCSDSNWQSTGTVWVAGGGLMISTTEHIDECTTIYDPNCPADTVTLDGTYNFNGSNCIVEDWTINENTTIDCEDGTLYYNGTGNYLFDINQDNIQITSCNIELPIKDTGTGNNYNNINPLYISYNEYKNYPNTLPQESNIITNFDITNVTMTLENQHGKIEFSEPVNIGTYGDIDTIVEISAKKATVISTLNPSMNQEATITFYNTNYDNKEEVIIWKDDIKQTAIDPTLSNGNVTITVTGFSTYELKKFLYGEDLTGNDMTGAVIDTGTKVVVGIRDVATIIGLMLAVALIIGTVVYLKKKNK